jgi:hypothetical protein
VLKLVSIFLVSAFITNPPFPAPEVAPGAMVAYFQAHPTLVLVSAFLQFGSAIPLGIFVVTAVSRLRFLGVQAAGVDIALYGGLAVAFDSTVSAFIIWVLTWPGITQDPTLVLALNYLQFAFGGPGFAVPMGLFLAGVSVVAGLMKLLPRWIVWLGLVLAVVGELSWFSMIFPLTFLIPLTRFPAFIWLIAAGFALPKSAAAKI